MHQTEPNLEMRSPSELDNTDLEGRFVQHFSQIRLGFLVPYLCVQGEYQVPGTKGL